MLVFIGVYLFQFKTAHSKTHYQSSIKLLICKAQKIKTLSRDPAAWYICHLFLLFYIEMKGNVGGYVALPLPTKLLGGGVAPVLASLFLRVRLIAVLRQMTVLTYVFCDIVKNVFWDVKES